MSVATWTKPFFQTSCNPGSFKYL